MRAMIKSTLINYQGSWLHTTLQQQSLQCLLKTTVQEYSMFVNTYLILRLKKWENIPYSKTAMNFGRPSDWSLHLTKTILQPITLMQNSQTNFGFTFLT